MSVFMRNPGDEGGTRVSYLFWNIFALFIRKTNTVLEINMKTQQAASTVKRFPCFLSVERINKTWAVTTIPTSSINPVAPIKEKDDNSCARCSIFPVFKNPNYFLSKLNSLRNAMHTHQGWSWRQVQWLSCAFARNAGVRHCAGLWPVPAVPPT